MKKNIFKVILVCIIIISISAAKYSNLFINITDLHETIKSYGVLSPIIFILFYTISIIFLLPASVFTILGGLIFGLYLGSLYNLIAATLGASISFLISRYLTKDFIYNRIEKSKIKKLMSDIENHGWQFVAFLRLVPIFPFNLLNYILGLTTISFPVYAISSAIFMIPGCIAYTYIGTIGVDLASADAKQILTKVLIASILVGGLILLSKWMKKIFKK